MGLHNLYQGDHRNSPGGRSDKHSAPLRGQKRFGNPLAEAALVDELLYAGATQDDIPKEKSLSPQYPRKLRALVDVLVPVAEVRVKGHKLNFEVSEASR